MAHPDRVEIFKGRGGLTEYRWLLSRGGRVLPRQGFVTLAEAQAWAEDAFEICVWRRLAYGHYIAVG